MPGKKTGIVTGASGGIGSGLLARFLIERHTVIATSRNANAKLTVSGSPAALAGDILRKSLALMLAICSVDCRRKPQICCCQQARPYLQGGRVSDSGEGRWTIKAAIDDGVPVPELSAALYERFSSRRDADYQDKLLSAMRYQFGGHVERPVDKHAA